jgi:hypothetical protein
MMDFTDSLCLTVFGDAPRGSSRYLCHSLVTGRSRDGLLHWQTAENCTADVVDLTSLPLSWVLRSWV